MTEARGTDGRRRTGPALEAMYRFMLWLVPTVEKFPRSQKFLLGDRIQTTALDVLEQLIEATFTRARGSLLAAANLRPGWVMTSRCQAVEPGTMAASVLGSGRRAPFPFLEEGDALWSRCAR
jgi:hypothetical protein